MVKILGIIGSPRKAGNTELIVKEALKAAQEAGAETEFLRLAEKNIAPCNGCLVCAKTKECVIEDDLMEVFEKMVQADGIIIASPVYYGSITPLTKALMDRSGYYNFKALDRTAFTGKVGGAITVANNFGHVSAWNQIIQFLLVEKMIVPGIGGFVCARGGDPGKVLKDTEGLKRSRELGKTITELASKLKSP